MTGQIIFPHDGSQGTADHLPPTHSQFLSIVHLASWLGHVPVLERIAAFPQLKFMFGEVNSAKFLPFDLAINQKGESFFNPQFAQFRN
jgi:hypothetical protein